MPPVSLQEARSFLANPQSVVTILRTVHSYIADEIRILGDEAFERKKNAFGKPYIELDTFAEEAFTFEIIRKCGAFVDVVGEETLLLSGLDLTDSSKINVLCDVIDGTDLFERELSNWCSAFIAFEPKRRRIISAHVYVVGGDVDTLYSAAEHSPAVTVVDYRTIFEKTENDSFTPKRLIGEAVEIDQPLKIRSLDEASIFSYGQKLKNFEKMSYVLQKPAIRGRLGKKGSRVRLFNLGGNPIMCKLLEGHADILFEFSGQAPHDAIPGAYIALRGGAVMYDLGSHPARESREIVEDDLIDYLLRPCTGDTKIRYLLATSHDLAQEFISLLLEAKVIFQEGSK